MHGQIEQHAFLKGMYADPYFPPFLVDKVKAILVELCTRIELEQPCDLPALYLLSHAATNAINALVEEFEASASDIETCAREVIGADFAFVARVYGFDVDIEEMIAPRVW